MFVLYDCIPDKWVLNLAQTLLNSNFNVKIIATHFNKQNKKKEKLKNGLIIERISILPLPFIKYFHFWIKSLIFYRNQNEDIIVCHDLNVLPIGTYLKSKNN